MCADVRLFNEAECCDAIQAHKREAFIKRHFPSLAQVHLDAIKTLNARIAEIHGAQINWVA